MKTTLPRQEDIKRKWYLIDASDKPLGRLAVCIANILRGRNKPFYTPHIDIGDFVVVIGAEKVRVTGRKLEHKVYRRYSGYRGGLKEIPLGVMLQNHPEVVIKHAVKGMLPKNELSKRMMRRLKVYAGREHPHIAQSPEIIELKIR